MGTRSVIAMSDEHGVHAIYCHWDGHIETNGVLLHENYQNRDVVEDMIDHGDMSSLGNEVVTTEFYHRDRGEPREQTQARTYSCMQTMLEEEFENSDREFVYVFLANNKWAVIDYQTAQTRGAQLLSDAVAELRRDQMHSV